MDSDHLTKKEKRERKKAQKQDAEQKKQKQSTMRNYIGWAIGVGILIGLGYFFKVAFTPPPPGSFPEVETVAESDHIKGATESAALIVEYSDFQCPACKAHEPAVQQLIEEQGERITFVYRNYPLPQHQNADAAARAAEAAGKQGKFWEMHDLLFEKQESWSSEKDPDSIFAGYAKDLELDEEQFTNDYNSQEVYRPFQQSVR